MFKELYDFTAKYTGVAFNFEKEFPAVETFLKNLPRFAFFDDLNAAVESTAMHLSDYLEHREYASIINILLKEQYLGYGTKPKALLKFHRYGATQRTPLEEHLVEGVEYARNSDGTVAIHFTISPEHRKLFQKHIRAVRKAYEDQYHIKLRISMSEQKHSTDTLAVDEYNVPVRDDAGRLVMRPGGHGALIENLNDCRADLIFIKNIDNVVPDWMKHSTIVYKKVLAGLLLDLQCQYFPMLKQLQSGCPNQTEFNRMVSFAKDRLHIMLPDTFEQMGREEQCRHLYMSMNRPIRICGMVKNQGEPGGGPFYVTDSQGTTSLQIVESAQIDKRISEQMDIMQQSTHFNPVDLVCGTKDYRGRYFDLKAYIDSETGFISKKSKGAKTVKSQELPGLWNGAMARWITLFVEVPLATFNPVKTVNDLLRKEHLEQ